jgi:tetratricopeptide (TPR) repeat protein/DNA-binding XRE family transcriptional regulator
MNGTYAAEEQLARGPGWAYIASMPGPLPARSARSRGIVVKPEAVRRARLEAGLSLAQVAEGGVTRAAIHLVETGRTRPSMRTLELIARKTGRPVAYFLPAWDGTEEQRTGRDELQRLFETEDFHPAVQVGERLLEQQLPPGLEADVRFYLGSTHVRMHDGKRALLHVGRARQLYADLGDARMLVEALDQEATAFYLVLDPRARLVALDALHRCEMLQPTQPGLQVRVLLHLGSMCQRDGDRVNAARFLEMGLELARSAPNPRHIAMMHDALSLTYQGLGRFSDAVVEAQRASRLYAMDRDVRSMARVENNLGFVLLRQGKLDAAEAHLARALELCEERGLERQGKAYVLCSLAELHIARSRLDEAEECLREVVGIAESHGETGTLAQAWRLRGVLAGLRRDDAATDAAYEESIRLYRTLHMPERLRECLTQYAEALQERGLLERSIAYWREAAEAAQPASRTSTAAEAVGA